MKKLIILFLLTIPYLLSAQNLGKILDANYAIRGGLDKFKKLESIKVHGEIAGKNNSIYFTVYKKGTNKIRSEVVTSGDTLTMVINGNKAWSNGQKPSEMEEIPQDVIAEIKEDMMQQMIFYYNSLLLFNHDRDLKLIDIDTIDNKPYYVIEYKTKRIPILWWVDPETSLEYKMEKALDMFLPGRILTLEPRKNLLNSGFYLPYQFNIKLQDIEIGQIRIKTVEINKEMDEKLFEYNNQ